jgi:CDP-glycerol glycerophosphotransferase (TagB/SpsB family)
MASKRVLFTGYAPVHFLCFLPLYRRLQADPRVEVWLSGGFRSKDEDHLSFAIDGFYDPFPVDRSRVIAPDRIRDESYDVLVCAHLSDTLFPGCAHKTVQIFHGVSFKNLAVREQYLDYDYLCLAGRYHAQAYHRAGLARREGQCLVTGMPKLDCLVMGAFDRDEFLRARRLDPALPTVLYAPTGTKHNSMETMGLDVIARVGMADKWNLLIKLHDHPKNTAIDWAALVTARESDRIRLVREVDVVPYLQAADVLLTDASSVSIEYTLLDRPMVFLDVPELLQNVVARGGFLDLETHGRKMGDLVERAEEVPAALADALAHPERHRAERLATARHMFHDPGRATERVAGVNLHAAGLAAMPESVKIPRTEPAAAQAGKSA